MEFRVRLSLRAARDAEEIHQHICRDGSEFGRRWYDGLIAALDSLTQIPTRCPVALFLSTKGDEIRQLSYGRKPHIYEYTFASLQTSSTCSTFATALDVPYAPRISRRSFPETKPLP